jgi:hypothetical protein
VTSPLASLPDDQLLSGLQALVRRGNAFEAALLGHLGEVDARRLYLGEGCPSMFAYCVRVLHFAESVAYKRIAAARAARRVPAILEAVHRGDLHVTGVSLLAPRLSSDNGAEWLAAARHQTADAIRQLLADRQPKPDVPASVRRVATQSGSSRAPEGIRTPIASGDSVRATFMSEREDACRAAPNGMAPPTPFPGETRPERARTEPLGGERYCVRFTADRELHAQIEELRALMRHQIPDGDVGKILARAVAVLLEQVRKRKLGQTDKPRPAKPTGERSSRHVPARIRREVSKRDGERCTYVSPGGRRCGAREFLEFHHADPWARSRAHAVEDLTLRCRAHNQYAATRDFGERHMARFRADRTRRKCPDPTGTSPPAPPGSANWI